MQALHDAILDALLNGGVLSDEMLEPPARSAARRRQPGCVRRASAAGSARRAVQQIIERLTEQGYVSRWPASPARRPRRRRATRRRSRRRDSRSPTRRSIFSATARCAICSGRWAAAAPAGTTRASSATGVEAGGPPRPYEFGDTLNLDAAATVLNAVQRACRRAASRSADSSQRPLRQRASTSTTKI